MENSTFTQLDITLIQRELSRKTYSDIAFLLDKTVEEVREFADAWCAANNIISYQQLQDQKRKQRIPQPRKKKEKVKKPVVISRIVNSEPAKVNQGRMTLRAGQRQYATKEVDYSRMQTVRIDDKTVVYCKPGETPAEAKERYLFNKLSKQHQAPAEREATFRKIV